MDKKPDFDNDLSAIADEVTADVGDMLKALARKKPKSPHTVVGIATLNAPQPGRDHLSSMSVMSERPRTTTDEKHPASRREQRTRVKLETKETLLRNVTTRLCGQTNSLLTEAALRQRLKKVSPNTRQDIIETALREWFGRHGYARGKAENDHDDIDAE